MRILAQSHIFPGDACALRDRDGRGVGHWRVAGDGISPAALAGDPFWGITERLLGGVLACRGGGAFCPADVGLAADVLAGRPAGTPGVLYIRACARIGSLEAASRAIDGRGAQDRRRSVEKLPLSCSADDLHDVPFARHAGPVPGFPRERA